jgi:hypothetical protein
MGFADDQLQPFQQIAFISDRFAIDPGSVRHDGFLGRQDPLYGVKPNVRLRRATTGRYLIFQKDSQNFNALERTIGAIRQFQANAVFSLDESKGKRLLFDDHGFVFFLALRFLPPFFWFASVSMSPGWHSSTRHIFSSVSRFMPKALPFFNRHSVV